MDTATAIAIAAPNAVAATAIIIGWIQHGKSLGAQRELASADGAHQRQLSDLANLRDVADAAAVALHRVAYTLDGVRAKLSQLGAGLLEDTTGAATYEELIAAGEDLDVLAERLALRLGRNHNATVAFNSASEAALAIFRAIDLLKLAPPQDSTDERLQRHRFELGSETRDKVTAHREIFDAQREAFIAAAHAVAGADLGS